MRISCLIYSRTHRIDNDSQPVSPDPLKYVHINNPYPARPEENTLLHVSACPINETRGPDWEQPAWCWSRCWEPWTERCLFSLFVFVPHSRRREDLGSKIKGDEQDNKDKPFTALPTLIWALLFHPGSLLGYLNYWDNVFGGEESFFFFFK